MVRPADVTWEAEEHTLAKIQILHLYLQAWFPILRSFKEKRMTYIDGFAGPGEYPKSEGGFADGSPIVALDAALKHDLSNSPVRFIFVEDREDRSKLLNDLIERRYPERPGNMEVSVVNAKFDAFMTDYLSTLERRGASLGPAFVFIDPFGWTDIPMRTISRILRHRTTEVMITFMVGYLKRFTEDSDVEDSLTELFGSAEDLPKIDAATPDREAAILDAYIAALQKAGAQYVLKFRMLNKRNQTEYYLIHCSNDPKLAAVRKMKQAMWKVDRTGDFSFSDKIAGQQTLLADATFADFAGDLRKRLLSRFRGQTVSWDDIDRFVLLDTPYHDGQFNRDGLQVLEKEGKMTVLEIGSLPQPRPKRGYPKELRPYLRFRFEG